MVWFEAHFCNLGLRPLDRLVCIWGRIRRSRHLIDVVSTFRNVIKRSIQPLFGVFGGKSFILGLYCCSVRRLVVIIWDKHWRRTTDSVCQKRISCSVVGTRWWIALEIDCIRRASWYFHRIILRIIQIVIGAINISWIKVFKESCSPLNTFCACFFANLLRWSLANGLGCSSNQEVTRVRSSHRLIAGWVVSAANRGRRNRRGLLLLDSKLVPAQFLIVPANVHRSWHEILVAFGARICLIYRIGSSSLDRVVVH